MSIAIDAMGGDHAPTAIVEGAVRARRELNLDVVLVGQAERVGEELARYGADSEIPVFNASEVVAMDEPPMKAIRSKVDSSIRKAFELVKTGQAQAVVSAGNSGAIMAGAVLILGRVKGIDRPALASVFPSMTGPTVLIDVGANMDCQPRHLLQFGIMADVLAKTILGYPNPKVALLSVGEEDAKGNEQTRRAHDLLRHSSLNFIGNVEGRDIFSGSAQVIVCDGFVGNVCLKLSEGMAQAMTFMLKREFQGGVSSQLGAWLLKPAFGRFQKTVDYAEYGGAPLLGVRGAVYICHGSSNCRAIMNAARVAGEGISQGYNAKLAEALTHYRELTDEAAESH